MIAKTPLYELHTQHHAYMVDFHGWNMPLHYGSQIEEHRTVRTHAGIFDVSHMTIVDILGAGGRQFLRKLLTNDVDQLQHSGRALYSCMCNEHGGIIDDLIAYQRAPDNHRLILNSATKKRDLAWIQQKSEGFAMGLQIRNELSMLAIQGPEAIAMSIKALTPAQSDAISTLAPFECVEVDNWFFARTGYTGEDGLEIIVPNSDIQSLWQTLTQAGIQPCGLAARDTLRLEAGLLLYGQDMDESITPLESGLSWTIKWQPRDRDFIGMGALSFQKEEGIERKLVGLILDDKGIMRSGQRVFTKEGEGIITSGTYSPTLNKSIALARIPNINMSEVLVEIRGKKVTARVGKPRFISRGQIVWS